MMCAWSGAPLCSSGVLPAEPLKGLPEGGSRRPSSFLHTFCTKWVEQLPRLALALETVQRSPCLSRLQGHGVTPMLARGPSSDPTGVAARPRQAGSEDLRAARPTARALRRRVGAEGSLDVNKSSATKGFRRGRPSHLWQGISGANAVHAKLDKYVRIRKRIANDGLHTRRFLDLELRVEADRSQQFAEQDCPKGSGLWRHGHLGQTLSFRDPDAGPRFGSCPSTEAASRLEACSVLQAKHTFVCYLCLTMTVL